MLVRKTVTVLFCDLVGSTALGDGADPELLRETMAGYHAELRQVLERHGGTVEKFVGDAAMAVFGLPQAHEDDALRAVRAADEIQKAVERLRLDVRIGINTGEVVAGEGETLVTGDAVNVAARLEQAAEAGEILLGQRTERLVRTAVRSEPVEPLALRGKAKPVPAYRLVEILADVPAFTRRVDAPFVGREAELATLERALATAAEQRQPQLATVVGPPGIGKSRLARELIQRADARVVVGRCLSYGEGITYWPLREIAAQLGDVGGVVGDRLAAERIEAAIGAGEASPDEIAWGFRKLFEALARERPLIVVVDDIHWAEATLLDLIEYVATYGQDAPLLLLCMARPDLYELRPAWTNPKPNATLLALEPLAEEQAETLVTELGELSERTKTRIVEAAEGNPLFVEQLVAHQAESENGELEIPPTLQALLAARIDRLEPEERAVIERASVEGRLFHRSSVAELAPEPVRPRVGAHLLTLVRKEFIRPDRAELPGDDGFRFGHILIRDAAYDSIPKRLRAELHERFAAWLEAKLAAEAAAEILGYHLAQAYRYRVELGHEDEHSRRLATRAGRLLAEAGRRAFDRGDVAATSSLLGAACDLLPAEDPARPSLLVLLGSSAFNLGNRPHAAAVLEEAQRAAAAAGQRAVELRARVRELYGASDDPGQRSDVVLAEAEALVAELEGAGEPEALADAWWLVSMVGNMRSDFALKEEASRQRLVVAQRAGLRRHAANAASVLVAALAQGPTPVAVAIPEAERLLVDFPDERPGEAFLASLYAGAGRDREAVEAIERARRRLLELGERMMYAASAMDVGWIALLAGQPRRAEQELRLGAEILEAAGDRGWLSTVAAVLAEVLYQLDRDVEAEEWTRRGEDLASPEDVISQASWRGTRAKVLARRGEAERSLRLSAEAVEQVRICDNLGAIGACLFNRGEVLRLLGRDREARPVLEEALAVYERKGIVPSIERTRALLDKI